MSYFQELKGTTKTGFWINNPSGQETDLALSEGATSCTTNPAYCSKLIKSDNEYLTRVIDETVKDFPEEEDASVIVYRKTCKRIMEKFLPLYKKSEGTEGFVTMQDDPRKDHDTESTIKTVFENRKVGENYMAKIPVIRGGIEAIEICVEENIPICATEVFSLDQAILVCERYEQASRRTGNSPPFFVTHISGIFDEYLEKVIRREKIKINPELIKYAGLSIAKKEYDLLKSRGYQALLLGGGARGMHHFTEMVGGDAHITINWSTAKEIIDSGLKVENLLNKKTSEKIVEELKEYFPDYRKAYDEGGLSLEEFAGFGPVQLFRNAFLTGWYQLLAEITSWKQRMAL